MNSIFVGGLLAIILAVLAFFQAHWMIWVWSLIWWCILALVLYVDGGPVDRRRVLKQISRRDNAFLYTTLVDRLQGFLTRVLSPDLADPKMLEKAASPKAHIERFFYFLDTYSRDTADLKSLQRSAWSWPVLSFAMKLAVIYPLVLLMIQWGISGANTGIGAVTALPAEERWWVRLAATGPIVLLLITRMLASATQRRVFEKAAEWLIWTVFAGAVAAAGAAAAAGAGAGAAAAAGAGAVAAAGAFTVAGAFAGAFAFAAAFAAAFAFAVAAAGAGAFAVAAAGAGAVAAAFAAAHLVGRAAVAGWGRSAHIILVFCAVTIVSSTLILTKDPMEPDPRLLIFVFGLLPAVNALFDYLSYGLTLTLIRKGRIGMNAMTLVWGVIDAIAAVIILIGLGLTLVALVSLINSFGTETILDLPQTFSDLRDPQARGDYGWLIIMLLSTLVPTLVHLVLVMLSAFTWVPHYGKYRLAQAMGRRDAGEMVALGGAVVWSILALTYTALVTFGLYGMWIFIGTHIETLGLWVLNAVQWLSKAAGLI